MTLQPKIHALQTRFQRNPGVAFVAHGELIAAHVENQVASARIFLQGAQVSSFCRKNQKDLLWLSPTCDFKTGNSLRGGIPICWPWFGEFSRNDRLLTNQIAVPTGFPMPAHGLVRSMAWDLASIDDRSPDCTNLTFGLLFDGKNPRWPFRSELFYRVSVGERLDVSLTINNTDELPQTFTEALHTYFAIGDHQHTTLGGLENLDYMDAFGDWKNFTQGPGLNVGQPLNRVYQQNPRRLPVEIIDAAWGRTLAVTSPESASTVIWNPGLEHGKKLSCFPTDAYRGMVCVENGNVLRNFVTLPAGRSHTLSAQFTIK